MLVDALDVRVSLWCVFDWWAVCVYLKACECVEQLIQMCYFREIQQTQCDSVRNHAELNLFHRVPRFCASRICARMLVCVVLWLLRSLRVCVWRQSGCDGD